MNRNSGDVVWRSLFFNSLVVSGVLSFQCDRAFAQITPDDTLGDESSVVNPRDASSESIDGGAIRGQNLFHSFEEFNVGEDRGVYFANPDAVTNIFSRVTGNDVSDILGTLGVDGAANLFLINPNGIVFGEGASLDLQGSFAATTADGIEFGEQGFFSVSNPESPKLLTINPSAYLFNQVSPGAIANNSQASADFNPETSFDDGFFGLRVPDGQNLLLLGGDISANGGGLVASSGRIDLGAVTGQGVIGLNNDGSLNIPDSIARGDVSLTNGAGFLVAGDGGGDIAIAAKNISIFSASSLSAGIYNNLSSPDAQAGDVFINATDNLTVDNSRVANEVNLETVGNAGDIFINANSLQVLNGSQIGSPTFGRGDGGNVTVRASNIELAGTSSDGQLTSGLFTTVLSQAQGNGGNLTINTDNLSLRDRAEISASALGEGNTGNIVIKATDNISLDNESLINSNIEQGAVGNGGQIEIDTNTLDLTNGGQVLTIVREAGNNLPAGQGNAGDIAINVDDTLTLDGTSEDDQFLSAIYSDLNTRAEGNAGNIKIKTGNLIIRDGGVISSSTFGQGNAGDITIQATDSVTFNGLNGNNYSSAFSNVGAGGVGNGGEINITARSLSLTNGGQLEASVREAFETLPGGKGQGGNIKIDVDDTLAISGENVPGIFANLGAGADGNAGDINIQTGKLVIEDGGKISASTFGRGDSGNLSITADNSISLDASYILNNVQDISAVGDAGKIEITTGSLSATKGSQINSFTRGQGNAGDITIQATDKVTFDRVDGDSNYSGIYSTVEAGGVGDGGNIKITAGSLSLTNGGQISASVFGQTDTLSGGKGQGGNVSIDVDDTLTIIGGNVPGIFANLVTGAVGSAGKIDIQTGNLLVKDGGQINSFTRGQGDAGDITIQATDKVTFDGVDGGGNYSGVYSTVEAGGDGDGGNIKITADSLSLTNGGQLEASVREASDSLPGGKGQGGNVNISVDDALTIAGENALGIFARLDTGAIGSGGDIDIQAANLVVRDGGNITASTLGQGDSGNLSITADNSISLDASDIVNNVEDIDAVGDAGTIEITTGSLSATNGSQINSFTLGQGDAGDITIQATDSVTFDGASGSVSNIGLGGEGDGGSIDIVAGSLSFNSNSLITTGVLGQGNAGRITITTDFLSLTNSSGIDSSTFGQGNAGRIEINANSLSLDNIALITSLSSTTFKAGDITLNIVNSLQAKNSFVSTLSDKSSGGNLTIAAGDIQLRGDSDITTNIFSGEGSGGNIDIKADSVIAFDDSDIFASAPEGQGGNINLDTPAFFAENFTLNSLTTENTDILRDNNRADVNATGRESGTVAIPDVSFIQNSLSELENNSINTDELVANSCVSPVDDREKGKFIITGTESLPVRPGDEIPSKFPTGEVRSVPEKQSSWQPGDPIVEPQGAYRLANGKLVLSRECSQ
jgi:filamentous hemagglutinin family protein